MCLHLSPTDESRSGKRLNNCNSIEQKYHLASYDESESPVRKKGKKKKTKEKESWA